MFVRNITDNLVMIEICFCYYSLFIDENTISYMNHGSRIIENIVIIILCFFGGVSLFRHLAHIVYKGTSTQRRTEGNIINNITLIVRNNAKTIMLIDTN